MLAALKGARLRIRWIILPILLLASASALSDTGSYEVKTDGEGGYVYYWAGEKTAFSLDTDQDGRADIISYFWGERTVRVEIESRSGRPEMMAILSENGRASWFSKQDGAVYSPLSTSEGIVPADAKDLLYTSVARRIRIDDERLDLKPVSPAQAPPLSALAPGEPSPLTIVLYPAQEAPLLPKDRKESPLPIRLPPISVLPAQENLVDQPDLWLPMSAFNDADRARASAKLSIFLYRTVEAQVGGKASETKKRIQFCIHILVQSQRDDRFCVNDEFPETGSLFTNAPSTDLTGRAQGSWFIEIFGSGAAP